MAAGRVLQIKRGLHSTLGTLNAGELFFETDTYKVFIGDGSTNHLIGPEKVIKQFTTAMTQAQFASMIADMTIDVIEMQGGTYQDWHNCAINVDRSARPLLIRPAPGAAVIWDGTTDTSTDGVFYFGTSTTKAAYITIDAAGTGGSFTVQNYNISETGLFNFTYTDHLTVNGIIIKLNNDSANDGWTRWAVYTHLNGSYYSSNLTLNDWDCDATGGDGYVNHIQLNNVVNGTFKRWRVKGARFGCHFGSGNSAIVIEGWIMTAVTTPFDNENSSYVTVRDCLATADCGAAILGTNTTDGGGNVWAGVLAQALIAADHGTASTDQIVNVCYGTGSPPTASTTTEGTLFIQYTA